MTEESLYKRLGSYDIIASITDYFLVRLVAHEQMKRFFLVLVKVLVCEEGSILLTSHVLEQGGPCIYTGRAVKELHKGLGTFKED